MIKHQSIYLLLIFKETLELLNNVITFDENFYTFL